MSHRPQRRYLSCAPSELVVVVGGLSREDRLILYPIEHQQVGKSGIRRGYLSIVDGINIGLLSVLCCDDDSSALVSVVHHTYGLHSITCLITNLGHSECRYVDGVVINACETYISAVNTQRAQLRIRRHLHTHIDSIDCCRLTIFCHHLHCSLSLSLRHGDAHRLCRMTLHCTHLT